MQNLPLFTAPQEQVQPSEAAGYDFRSSAIERKPGRKVCVRVVSQFGEESSKVLTIK